MQPILIIWVTQLETAIGKRLVRSWRLQTGRGNSRDVGMMSCLQMLLLGRLLDFSCHQHTFGVAEFNGHIVQAFQIFEICSSYQSNLWRLFCI